MHPLIGMIDGISGKFIVHLIVIAFFLLRPTIMGQPYTITDYSGQTHFNYSIYFIKFSERDLKLQDIKIPLQCTLT